MPKFIIFLILFIAQGITVFGNDFYDAVLNDFSLSSFYISINVKVNGTNEKYVIENTGLYLFLSKERGIDYNKEDYKKFVKELLISGRSLELDERELDKRRFIKVEDIESVNKNADKGAEHFLAHYFNKRLIKSGLDEKVTAAVINKLFEWKIASFIDHGTGYLVYVQPR